MAILTLDQRLQQNAVDHKGGVVLYSVDGASDEDIVASVLPTNTALTIVANPSFPAQLVLVLTDGDSSIAGAMTATIVGADENGDAQTGVETFGGSGTETIITSEWWTAVTSITLATSAGASGADRIKVGTALGATEDFSFPRPGIWNGADAAEDDLIARGPLTHLLVTYLHTGGSTDADGLNVQESLDGSTVDDTPWQTTATSDGYVKKVVELSAPYFKFNADGDATPQTRLDLRVVGLVAPPFETVPEADGTANDQLRDVVGNKEDAAVETVGTVASLMAYQKGLLNAIGGASVEEIVVAPYVFGPQTVQTDDTAARYSVPLVNLGGDILADGETVPGNFTVRRVRAGTDTEIIASTGSAESSGVISATVDLTAGGNWDEGDLGYIEFSGITATVGGTTTELPVLRRYFRVTQETDIETAVDAILTDTGTAGVVLGTKAAAYKKLVGERQVATTTEDLDQAAATYDLLTGTNQVVVLTGFSIKMPTGAAGGAVTSISIQTDDATPGVIFDADAGQVANLTSEAELSWTGFMRIEVGTKIQLTIAGGAHGSAYVVKVTARCESVVDGGSLA